MIDPTINEMEEEVVSQPTEPTEPTGEEPKKIGEEPKKETKQIEQVLFELKDGNQVNVVSSAIEDFKKKFPEAKEVVPLDNLGKKPDYQTDATAELGSLKNPTKIVGDDGELGEVKVDVTQDDLDNVTKVMSQNDVYPLAMSEQKLKEIDALEFNYDYDENLNAQVTEFAKQFSLDREAAAFILHQKFKADKLDEIYKNDEKKIDALAKVYAEKNNINYDVAKSLFKKVYDEAFDIKHKLDTYQQSELTANTMIEQSPKNKYGDVDFNDEAFSQWQTASETAAQAMYSLIQSRIARGEYEQAYKETEKLKSFLWQKANVESHHSYNKGVGVNRLEYARKTSSYADALAAKIQYSMGNYDEAKRLEQKARDNGAYQGMEKLEEIQAKINETKDEKEKERLQKEYQDEYTRISLPVVGGEEYGYKQPEVSTGSTYGFSGKNAPGTSTPTAESEYLKDIAGAAELASGLMPLKDAEHLIGDGFKDLGFTQDPNTYIGYKLPKSPISVVAGILKIAMGLSVAKSPSGFLTFEAFTAANTTPEGQKFVNNTIMYFGNKIKPWLRSMGFDEKDVEDGGLITDISAAILLHGAFKFVKGKVETNSAYKKLQEQIESGNVDENVIKDLWNSVDPKQQRKIIRKIAEDYKNNPMEVKKELASEYAKVFKLIASKTPPKKSSYVAEEHPTTVSEIKNDSKVVMKDGTEGTFNISDEGIMSVTDAQGNKTIIKTTADAPVSEAGVQLVKSKVSEELEAQARVNRPESGTIVVNGKKYFVSLEGKTGDGLGDFVFEMDEKGRMYNTFDVNPNKDLVGQNKLDIVNSFRDKNGMEKVTEVTDALPADAEPVSSAEAVTQKVAKLRKVEATEGADRASVKESKRAITDLLAKNPKVKFVYDNMREVLEQITNNERFKLKGDCL